MDTTVTAESPVKIIIIEDDPVIMDGYAYFINAREGFTVVNTYSSAEEALKKLSVVKPDVILLDIGLPGMSGVEAIPRIRQQLPEVLMLILSVYESEEMIFGALTGGASGYLTKNCSPEKILDSINDLVTGGGSMSANVASLVIKSFRRNEHSPLSPREHRSWKKLQREKPRQNRHRTIHRFRNG